MRSFCSLSMLSLHCTACNMLKMLLEMNSVRLDKDRAEHEGRVAPKEHCQGSAYSQRIRPQVGAWGKGGTSSGAEAHVVWVLVHA